MTRSIFMLASAGLLAVGCSGGGSPTTLPPTDTGGADPVAATYEPGSAGLGDTLVHGDLSQSAFALFTLEIDPETLSATSHLKATRSGQATDDIYLLDIGNFTTPSTFRVQSISSTPTTLTLSYLITHPFNAPSNLNGPATAANRADLGISGRVLFLTDVPDATGNTYFSNVVANTTLVTNADAYYKPAGLLTLSGFNTNTFPYRRLVDEGQNPRTSSATGGVVDNGGQPEGNYLAADGWQRGNIGAGNDGWTGFGVLHQGQAASNSLTLDRVALAAGGFSFDTAIIAKYEDPRGGANAAAKKANRLPASPADITKFVYREPHGALDVEAVEFLAATGDFVTNQISASTMEFRVTDWDARATESTFPDLALDPDPTKVEIGESGTPTLSVSIPGVTGDATSFVDLVESPDDDDSAVGGDAGQDSGVPGDALYYSELITKTAISGQADGTYTGLVRATDPEADLATKDWYFPLKGDLSGAATPAPRPETYQVLTVAQVTPNDAPTLTATTPANVLSGATTTIDITAANDNDGEAITIEIDWNDDLVYEDTKVINPPYTVPVTYTRPASAKYNNATLTPEVRTINLRYTDGVIGSPIDHPDLTFTLGPNRPPGTAGTPVLTGSPACAPATFGLTIGTVTAIDPEGDTVSYIATANVAPTGPFGTGTMPITGIGPYNTLGAVQITLYARDPLHQNTVPAQPDSAVAFAPLTATVAAPPSSPPACPPYAPAAGVPIGPLGDWGGLVNRAWVSSVSFWGYWDLQAFRGGSPYPDNWVMQHVPSSSAGPWHLWRTTSSLADPFTQVTNLPNNLANLGTQINSFVIDSTNRIIFTHRPTVTATDTATVAVRYTNAGTAVKWVEYSGTPATTLAGSFVAPNPILFLEVDQFNHLYTVDTTHMLRRYLNGCGGYVQDTTAPWPINLAAAPYSITDLGTATTDINNRRITGMVMDYNSRAIFLLTQARFAATAPGNGFLYRVECDGTFLPVVAGNVNPARFHLNTSATWSQTADLFIDQHNAAGGLLPQGQQQIMSFSGSSTTTVGLADDLRYWNSDLLNYTSWNIGTSTVSGMGTVTSANSLIGRNAGTVYLNVNHWTIPPPSWQ